MEVLCPRHKKALQIEHTTLSVLSVSYPAVVGICHICNQRFINRNILLSSGTIKIDGISYEYLGEMEKAYPVPKETKALSSQSRNTNTHKDSSKNNKFLLPDNPHKPPKPVTEPVVIVEVTPPKKKEKKKKVLTSPAHLREIAAKTEADIQAKIDKRRQSYLRNPNQLFIPKRLFFLPSRDNFPRKCPYDGTQLDNLNLVKADYDGMKYHPKGSACMKCMVAYVEKPTVNMVVSMRLEKEAKEKNKPTPVPQSQPKTTGLNSAASPSTDNVNFAVSSNILYVCKSANACRSKGHKVESATGMLLNHFNRVIQINTNYCPDCKKFFIGYDEYKRYRQLYNGLMGNIKITSGSFAFNANTLADESILHVCGYSTNQQDDLTTTERQNILKYLMDSGISSKSEIIDYLNYFIGRNGKKAGNHVALSRWQEDLSWVEQYRIDRQRRFEIAQIIKNR